jgi:putative membrane protein
MLEPILVKNDRRAKILIVLASVIIFGAIVLLGRVEVPVGGAFDVHVFAKINAVINSIVSVLLVGGLITVRQSKYVLHKKIMLTAIVLSVLFLVSYICHHLFAGDTKFGGVGTIRYFYFFILITHIFLAAIILPFILFTAYRAMISEFPQHKRIARLTWPIWLYVSVTGVLVYLMISPYYT